jgi:hypothetical protein
MLTRVLRKKFDHKFGQENSELFAIKIIPLDSHSENIFNYMIFMTYNSYSFIKFTIKHFS